jgi:hypothetical protein
MIDTIILHSSTRSMKEVPVGRSGSQQASGPSGVEELIKHTKRSLSAPASSNDKREGTKRDQGMAQDGWNKSHVCAEWKNGGRTMEGLMECPGVLALVQNRPDDFPFTVETVRQNVPPEISLTI